MNDIEIDGSVGEGGGQVLRTALSLSLITGRTLHISKIREGREKPGLLRQHLTCVKAAQNISDAAVEGDSLGSRELTFKPKETKAGDYHLEIGSAGSTSLVLQTIMLPLALLDADSQVSIIGGTHNKQAPAFEFIAKSFVPILARLGFNVEVDLLRHGFYPAGGGKLMAKIAKPGVLMTRLELVAKDTGSMSAFALSANLPERIGMEELAIVGKGLGLSQENLHYRSVSSNGPGNAVEVIWSSGGHETVVTAFGASGFPLEKVAEDAVSQAKRLSDSPAVVDSYLADQLLLPMALSGGGRFSTVTPTEQTRTNAEIITRILGTRISMQEIGPDHWLIEVN